MTAPRGAVAQRALIVANPVAGTTGSCLIAEVAAICREYVRDVRPYLTTGPGDAAEAVRGICSGPADEVPDLVVAVGGDGTVREVIEGLVAARAGAVPALFTVPAGTGNSGYRMLWGEWAWQDALSALLGSTGHPDRGDGHSGGAVRRHLDLAELAETGAKVFLGACSGVIAEALVTARRIPQSGRERYVRAFQETADTYTPYPGRVTVDGRVVHEGGTVLANVGGGRYRGGTFLVLPRSELDDGLLDVCVIGAEVAPASVPELTRHAEHLEHPGVVYGRGRRIVVERLDGSPLCFEHDGELQPARHTSMTLQVLPGALTAWGAASTVGSRA